MVTKHKHHDSLDEAGGVRRTLPAPSPDMNVTPLIDVLLVLLVIFMAALPLTQHGVDINLPLDVAPSSVPRDTATQVVIEYTADRHLSINRQATDMDALEPTLRDLLETRADKTLFLIGDGSVRYGEIVPIIDTAVSTGARVVIVTERMKADAGQKGP